MVEKSKTRLNPKKRYLQVALNGTLEDAHEIINSLPKSDRIIVEAGTPLIKRYGEYGIRQIRNWYEAHLSGQILAPVAMANVSANSVLSMLFQSALTGVSSIQETIPQTAQKDEIFPY